MEEDSFYFRCEMAEFLYLTMLDLSSFLPNFPFSARRRRGLGKFDSIHKCRIAGPVPPASSPPRPLPASVAQLDLKLRLTTGYLHVNVAERRAFPADGQQLRAARQPFGDLPLIVLARGVSPYSVPGQPQSEGNKAVEAAN